MLGSRNGRLDREQGHQGDADIGRDHLAKRLHAGGVEIHPFVRLCQGAHLERVIAQTVSLLQKQQLGAYQVVQRYFALAGQGVVVRERKDEGLFEQHLDLQALRVDRQCEQSGVELPRLQHGQKVFGLFLGQLEAQPGIGGTDPRHDVRQEVGRQGRKQAQPQRALRGVGAASRHRADLLDIVQDQPGARRDLLADGSQHDPLG